MILLKWGDHNACAKSCYQTKRNRTPHVQNAEAENKGINKPTKERKRK